MNAALWSSQLPRCAHARAGQRHDSARTQAGVQYEYEYEFDSCSVSARMTAFKSDCIGFRDTRSVPHFVNFTLQRKALALTRDRTPEMAAFTPSPKWINKMKQRFHALDVDKNGVLNDTDMVLLAKQLAGYNKLGPEVAKRYYEIVKAVWSDGIGAGAANEEQFIEGMKKFVVRPDAKERLKRYAGMVFDSMDLNKDGVISRDEYSKFHKAAANMSDETIDHFFDQTDVNKDGVISRAEEEAVVIEFVLYA